MVGSVTHGAFRRGPCHVVHSGMGMLKLARVDPTLPDLMHPGHQRMWDLADPRCEPSGYGEQSRGPADPSSSRSSDLSDPSDPAVTNDELRGGLFDLLLKTPGLEAIRIPSHSSLLQQVSDGPHGILCLACWLGRLSYCWSTNAKPSSLRFMSLPFRCSRN